MSSLYVRDLVRGWSQDAGLGLVLPYVETVNVETDPRVPSWFTLAWVSAQATRITYCGSMEESGSFDFIALGKPGIGDRELLAAAEHDVAILLAQADPTGRLTLLRASPPQDFLQGGSVPWYTVSMVIDYLYEQPVPVLP